MENNNKDNVRSWWAENGESIVVGVILLAGIGVSIWAAIKYNHEVAVYLEEQAREDSRMREEIQNAIAEGKSVLQNADGSYWIIPGQK